MVRTAVFARRYARHLRVRPGGALRNDAAAHAKRERIGALLDWKAPALQPPVPLPLPQCPGCGKTMVLVGQLARKPP